jgi:hypothetical protein
LLATPTATIWEPKYRRIASRRGPSKALLAIERAMLVINLANE